MHRYPGDWNGLSLPSTVAVNDIGIVLPSAVTIVPVSFSETETPIPLGQIEHRPRGA